MPYFTGFLKPKIDNFEQILPLFYCFSAFRTKKNNELFYQILLFIVFKLIINRYYLFKQAIIASDRF